MIINTVDLLYSILTKEMYEFLFLVHHEYDRHKFYKNHEKKKIQNSTILELFLNGAIIHQPVRFFR